MYFKVIELYLLIWRESDQEKFDIINKFLKLIIVSTL